MKEINIYKKPLLKALVSDIDFEYVTQFKWCFFQGYPVRWLGRSYIFLHHEILRRMGLQCSGSLEPDHKDRNPFNNQRENIRLATRSQNMANTKFVNSTGFRGVSEDGNKWRASVCFNYKRLYLGSFSTPQEAARAYDQKAKEVFGEFAMLDFPYEPSR